MVKTVGMCGSCGNVRPLEHELCMPCSQPIRCSCGGTVSVIMGDTGWCWKCIASEQADRREARDVR